MKTTEKNKKLVQIIKSEFRKQPGTIRKFAQTDKGQLVNSPLEVTLRLNDH